MLADCLAPFGTGASIGKVMSKGVFFMGLSIQFNPIQEQLCMKQFGINISALKQTWFYSSCPGKKLLTSEALPEPEMTKMSDII